MWFFFRFFVRLVVSMKSLRSILSVCIVKRMCILVCFKGFRMNKDFFVFVFICLMFLVICYVLILL